MPFFCYVKWLYIEIQAFQWLTSLYFYAETISHKLKLLKKGWFDLTIVHFFEFKMQTIVFSTRIK